MAAVRSLFMYVGNALFRCVGMSVWRSCVCLFMCVGRYVVRVCVSSVCRSVCICVFRALLLCVFV